jgi:hypothetical protein
VSTVDALKHTWQEWTGDGEAPPDGDTPAWIVSFAVHLGMLVMLALLLQPRQKVTTHLTVMPLDTQVVERLPEEISSFESDSADVGSGSLAGIEAAMAVAPTLDATSRVEESVVEEVADVAEPMLPDLASTAPLIKENLTIKGSSGVAVSGASGAVDRLTEVIAGSLETRDTLVVWILDQSLSMQSQRQTIVERLDRVYRELGIDPGSYQGRRNAPLLSSVLAFGNKVSFRVEEPTDDLEQIKQAISGIENDPSGVEMTFTAVAMAAKKYQSFRVQAPRRNVLLIVFSDEVGDDDAQLENAVSLCRRHEMPVYVVGVPAPFGKKEVAFNYVDPDPKFDQSARQLTVRQGPESFVPEEVRLAFSSGNDDLEHLDSGFGPFALTRLCYETGGTYFTVHPNRPAGHGSGRRQGGVAAMSARLDHFFDPAIMRTYQPDYVSPKEYQQKLLKNKARSALVDAAGKSLLSPMENPRLEFPKIDEAGFKRSLDEAQQQAAKLGPKLDVLYQVLKQGEKDRAKLVEPRWQAGYDLAMGRVLAVKVRTDAYNAMLAKAKTGMKFQNADSDTWVLEPANEVSVGSQLDKLAKRAHEYLDRVNQQHAGTPWALLAERELKVPIGWKWTEKPLQLQRQKMMAGGGGNNAPAKDNLRKLEKPKPKREDIKL